MKKLRPSDAVSAAGRWQSWDLNLRLCRSCVQLTLPAPLAWVQARHTPDAQ